MRLFGFGQDTRFYDILDAQADAAVRAARAFAALARDFANAGAHAERIQAIEHEADDLTHELVNKVDATFVTPLDKEDLNSLSGTLDDVTDAIEAASGRIILYQLTQVRPDLPPLADVLVEAAEATKEAIAFLRALHGGRDAFMKVLVRVHEAENGGDNLYREALATLFNAPGADPVMILKWKEVYDRIELALDACEDVSNAVESVTIKYA